MAKSKDDFIQAARDSAYGEGVLVGTAQTLISMAMFPVVMGFGVAAGVAAAPVVVAASSYTGPPMGRAIYRALHRLG